MFLVYLCFYHGEHGKGVFTFIYLFFLQLPEQLGWEIGRWGDTSGGHSWEWSSSIVSLFLSIIIRGNMKFGFSLTFPWGLFYRYL